MKRVMNSIVLMLGLVTSQVCLAQAPAGAPSGATGQCDDGTYSTAASKTGACRGHKGVKSWFAASSATINSAAKASSAKAAQTAAPSTAASAAPAGPAPAGATGQCIDGTYSTAASKMGACRGHKGVKTWFAAPPATAASSTSAKAAPASAPTATQPTPAPAKPVQAPAAPAPSPKAMANTTAPAPGGGAGQVWVNTASNIYHCPGSQFYGKTKAGTYMTETQAQAKGARPDRNKSCK
jgi:Protein of unknown function (DUF3761)